MMKVLHATLNRPFSVFGFDEVVLHPERNIDESTRLVVWVLKSRHNVDITEVYDRVILEDRSLRSYMVTNIVGQNAPVREQA